MILASQIFSSIYFRRGHFSQKFASWNKANQLMLIAFLFLEFNKLKKNTKDF